jgi:large subunit ribosomal protein L13Ae
MPPAAEMIALLYLLLSLVLIVLLTFTDFFFLFRIVTRNRVKYAQFRRKRMNTNPGRGPFHFKSPSLMVWRTIRGMLHQKSARGQEALARLSTFEGIPAPYDKQKRLVIPAALRVMRLKPGREYTVIGTLADSVGWKHKELLTRLEAKRKADSKEFYEQKKAKIALRNKAEAACASELTKVNEVLAANGY